MNILFIGGIFDESHLPEVLAKTKKHVEYAANNLQRKLIEGLRLAGAKVQVLSAPFVGPFPQGYQDIQFRGFGKNVADTSGYTYVPFNNVWGIRNLSRTRNLKLHLSSFLNQPDKEKLIIVYSPHTPFLQAAVYAKKKDPSIKICLIVPDLPQYMNLSANISWFYRILKKIDIKLFKYQNRLVDSYILLTQQMTDMMEVGNRPYAVVEGIYEPLSFESLAKQPNVTTLVYTGTLNRSFGILTLLQAFALLKDYKHLRLVICGAGEARPDVEAAAKQDPRIIYKGQVSPIEARKWILQGDILVNPRQNNAAYTKYSFPSKIIEYLATGNPVVAYKLDGMAEIYRNFIHFAKDNSPQALAKTIQNVLNMPLLERKGKSQAGLSYLENHLSKQQVGHVILELNQNKEKNVA